VSKFIEKLGSGRFFTTVFLITTYCVVIVGCVALAVLGRIDVSVFLALLSGFGTLVGMVVEGYFHKEKQGEKQ